MNADQKLEDATRQSETREHIAREQIAWLKKHLVSMHCFQSAGGETWRIDFANYGAADVALGTSFERCVQFGMTKTETQMKPLPGKAKRDHDIKAEASQADQPFEPPAWLADSAKDK